VAVGSNGIYYVLTSSNLLFAADQLEANRRIGEERPGMKRCILSSLLWEGHNKCALLLKSSPSLSKPVMRLPKTAHWEPRFKRILDELKA